MTQGAVVTYFRHDGIDLLEIADTSGNLTKVVHGYRTIPGIGSVVEIEKNGTRYYLHQDHRGTTYKITDSAGDTVWTGLCDAWGNVISETGSNPSIFWYQGQAWWKLTANDRLYYLSPTRIYDVEDGRFVERDPIKKLAGDYIYVQGDPAAITDPTGLEPVACCCKPRQKDATAYVNKQVNDILIQAANTPNANNDTLRKAIEDKLIGPRGITTLTGIERMLKQAADNGTIDSGVLTRAAPFGSAKCLKVCDRCIGTDKVSHFFEEGLVYYDIKTTPGLGEEYAKALGYYLEGLVPPNLTPAIRQWLTNGNFRINFAGRIIPNYPTNQAWAVYGDEAGGILLDPKGSASPADIAANEGGMKFWSQMMGANAVDLIKKGGRFDICRYVTDKWDQTLNPNVPGARRGSLPFSAPPPLLQPPAQPGVAPGVAP